jgi:NAD(P)H-flavin reductase
MAYRDSLAAWETQHGVKVVPVFSEDGQGYVQDVAARQLEEGGADWAGVAAVLCGRKEMCGAVTELLTGKGVPKENILLNF